MNPDQIAVLSGSIMFAIKVTEEQKQTRVADNKGVKTYISSYPMLYSGLDCYL